MRNFFANLRVVPALIFGLVVSFGLFLLMHSLISVNQQPKINAQQVNLVNFVTVHHDQTVQTINHNRPPPPPPPKKPPPTEKIQTATHAPSQNVQQLPVNVKFDANSLGGGGQGVFISANGGGNRGSYAPLTPMVRIPPIYPPTAQYQGVTGTVRTCFTVEPDGSVSNPHVVHASNPQARQMLGQAALQTILQWKFFPQKVNGKPVATKGVCQDIRFQIGNGNGG